MHMATKGPMKNNPDTTPASERSRIAIQSLIPVPSTFNATPSYSHMTRGLEPIALLNSRMRASFAFSLFALTMAQDNTSGIM